MSRVQLNSSTFDLRSVAAASAALTAGWLAGQGGAYDSTGNFVQVASGSNAMGVLMESTQYPWNYQQGVVTTPTGSMVTLISGNGRLTIDHTDEVALGSAVRSYSTGSGNPESGSPNADLWFDASGKFSTTPVASASGSYYPRAAKLIVVPSATNNYNLTVDIML